MEDEGGHYQSIRYGGQLNEKGYGISLQGLLEENNHHLRGINDT
ncbi:MAG: hypothetical protein ACU88J_14825 [Gammaproteobacteria bacterium]